MIDPSSPSLASSIFTTYLPSTGQVLALWPDSNNNFLPTYSVYTPVSSSTGSWSAPEPIPQSETPNGPILLSLNLEGKALATWVDVETGNPTYAYYTPKLGGGSWGEINVISNSRAAYSIISSCNTFTGEIIAVWIDDSSSFPTYSIYSPVTNSSSDPIPITQDEQPNDDAYFVNLAFDSLTGKTLAIWRDDNSMPVYSFYTPGRGWDSPSTISLGPNQSAIFGGYIASLFDPNSGQFLAVWSDNDSFNTCYSIYTSGSGWAVSSEISNINNYPLNLPIYSLSFDLVTGQILTTFVVVNAAFTESYPAYLIFQGPIKPQGKNRFSKIFFRSSRLF